MAGQIQELADQTLKGSFRHIDPTEAHVILLDAAPAVLPPMGEKLGKRAKDRLEKMGVEIQLNAMVTDVDHNGITVKDKDGTLDRKELHGRVPDAEWSAADPDNDKTITKAEYLAYVEAVFKKADADHDGTINAKELKTPAGEALLRLLK